MHYRIGGITETFQSTLVMMLAEQGRLNLDDKISRWFPDLLSADQVTIRMLVGNTAGYLAYARDEDLRGRGAQRALPHVYRRRADRLRGARPEDELSARHEPANTGCLPFTSRRSLSMRVVLCSTGRTSTTSIGAPLFTWTKF
jgi:CubicO group peptidase (beta-lactamase class C family)